MRVEMSSDGLYLSAPTVVMYLRCSSDKDRKETGKLQSQTLLALAWWMAC